MENVEAQAAFDQLNTCEQQCIILGFPKYPCLMPETPGLTPGERVVVNRHETGFILSWRERLWALLTGKLLIRVATVTPGEIPGGPLPHFRVTLFPVISRKSLMFLTKHSLWVTEVLIPRMKS